MLQSRALPLLAAASVLLAIAACGQSPVGAPLADQRLDQATTAAARSPLGAPSNMTTLQRHVAFFDGNQDGRITMEETREGLMALGMGRVGAHPAALLIHVGLGGKTESGARLVVDVKTIAKAKHDSDSGILDASGRFVPAAFDAMFAQFDANRSGSMSGEEFTAMRKARRVTNAGTLASRAEFGLLLKLAADTREGDEPALSRQRLQAFYDGSLFPELAAARKGAARP
jgi:peroxygenase